MIRKNSKKRQAVLDCLQHRKDNPSAEMLYQSLKPDYPELSLGTVYRNLGVLVQEGQAVSIGNVYGQERFDGRLDPHPHFVCRCCRRVIDLQLPDTVSALFDSMDEAMGYQPECYMLTIKGLCPDCRSVGTDKIEAKKKQYKEDMTVRKWICKVCGNVHEGDTPPELCPVCKVPGSKFVQPGEMPEVEPLFNEADLSAEDLDKAIRLGRGAEGESRTWVCGVCGNVHEGAMPPELCPVCKVTGSKFLQPGESREAPEDPEVTRLRKVIEGTQPAVERPSGKWKCPVCGYVHEGAMPPELCPVCKVTGSKFSAE